MSGHSKWASIKHKKAATDSKRGKIFTKIIRELSIAARAGGGDPDSNARLRKAISDAKAVNMPADNIKRAVMKGTGQLEGSSYEEITYEGYGPGGVALLIDCVTDNKNRTASELRHLFSKYGGTMAEAGAVSWNFEQKGYMTIPAENLDEDEVMMAALDAGAQDVEHNDDVFEVYTAPGDFHTVIGNLEKAGYKVENAELTRVPKTTVNADDVADKLNEKLNHLLNDTGKLYLSHTKTNGRYVLRMVTAQTGVQERHVAEAWRLIRETASAISSQRGAVDID
mgnify:CR=1 FL=1